MIDNIDMPQAEHLPPHHMPCIYLIHENYYPTITPSNRLVTVELRWRWKGRVKACCEIEGKDHRSPHFWGATRAGVFDDRAMEKP